MPCSLGRLQAHVCSTGYKLQAPCVHSRWGMMHLSASWAAERIVCSPLQCAPQKRTLANDLRWTPPHVGTQHSMSIILARHVMPDAAGLLPGCCWFESPWHL